MFFPFRKGWGLLNIVFALRHEAMNGFHPPGFFIRGFGLIVEINHDDHGDRANSAEKGQQQPAGR